MKSFILTILFFLHNKKITYELVQSEVTINM